MRRRQPPPAPPGDGLSDDQAAALERSVSLPGWRLDGPDWAHAQHAVVQLLASRWRRTPPEVQQARLDDARHGIYWPAGLKQYARQWDDSVPP